MRPSITKLLCLTFGATALSAQAAVTIDLNFEDGTGHTNTIPSNHYAGITLSNAAWIQPGFATFHEGDYGLGTDFGAGGNAWAFPGLTTPTVITFDDGGLASLFSIQAFDVGAQGARIRAFDSSGGLLGSDTAIGSGAGTGFHPTLSVTAPGIKTIHLLQTGLGSGDGIGWDNLHAEISAAPIPEPTRATLLALAATAITLRRRRR